MESSTSNKFKSVMIVDDNCIDQYIAQKIISLNHFCDKVMPYANPFEALHYLQTHQENPFLLPSLIFLDLYMPEMSGFGFMEKYDTFSDTLKKHCSVYIVSSTIDSQDLRRTEMDSNIVALHVKPINSEFLVKVAGKES